MSIDNAKKILQYATALHNSCMKTASEQRCNGCPFQVSGGCMLYGHPFEWQEKLKMIKEKTVKEESPI